MIAQVLGAGRALPWSGWVLLVSLLAAVLFSPLVARKLSCPRGVGFLLLFSVGLVVSYTLTAQPLVQVPLVNKAPHPGFAAYEFNPPWEWWIRVDRQLNVILFVPLGFSVGLVGERPVRRFLAAMALLMPFCVEAVQAAVPWLHRDGSLQDVLDNVIGVVCGLVLAAIYIDVKKHWQTR